jgi:hypothetical protein
VASALTTRARASRRLTDFDSSVNMVRAIGSFLDGDDHRAMSLGPGSPRLANALSSLPDRVRRAMYSVMGVTQGVPLNQVRSIDIDDIDRWVVEQYGPGPYPALMIGTASGGAMHLAAAMRAPFLPQTTLVSVRDLATHPDDVEGAMETLAPIARQIAANNPRISVHHMHDPAQDRPMLEGMAYMRLKRLELGSAYERFVRERLEPGAPIIQIECGRTWRTRAVGERSYFQFGCLGGVPEEEYHDSGERIADYLEHEDSPWRGWHPPEMDARRAEAEWGFDPAIAGGIRALAAREGHPVRRLAMLEPQELSPPIADLYRWWYRRRGLPGDRLLCESYVQWDPMWVLRTGAVPFWLRFNMEPAHQELERYLNSTEPYEQIDLNLFSQGIRSPGVVPVERWRDLIERHARGGAQVIGVDEDAYPVDLGSTLRYQPAFESASTRLPLPPPLDVSEFEEFLAESGHRYAVTWD